MSIKLSQHAGGGNFAIDEPNAIDFPDDTGYLGKTGIVSSGNKETFVVRFSTSPHTNNQYILCLRENAVWASLRMGILVRESDGTDPNKLEVFVYSSAATSTYLMRLLSDITVTDGEEYTAVVGYDGDTGNGYLYLNGEDHDDASWASRVAPTTGTLATGSLGTCSIANGYVGSRTTSGFFGTLGSLGFSTNYISDPTVFHNSIHNFPYVDEVNWTEWESQPLFWHRSAELWDNQGSGGNMTSYGNINLDGTYPFPTLGLPTIGDAVAFDIAEGKIAWVDGARIIGAKSLYTSRLLSWEIGSGPSGAYTPDIADAQYIADSISLIGSPAAGTKDGTGWIKGGSTYLSLPTKATNCRRCIYTVKFDTGATYPDRFHFAHNYVSGTNQVYFRVMWNTSAYVLEIYDFDGTETSKGSKSVSATLGLPTELVVVVDDYGDAVNISISGFETDTNNDRIVDKLSWYSVGRRGKTQTGVGWAFIGTSMSLHSVEILDLPDV